MLALNEGISKALTEISAAGSDTGSTAVFGCGKRGGLGGLVDQSPPERFAVTALPIGLSVLNKGGTGQVGARCDRRIIRKLIGRFFDHQVVSLPSLQKPASSFFRMPLGRWEARIPVTATKSSTINTFMPTASNANNNKTLKIVKTPLV